MHDLGNVGEWIYLSGGVIVALLGAFMLRVRPRRNANLGFAVFAFAYGASIILASFGFIVLDDTTLFRTLPLAIVMTITTLVALGGLAWVAASFPTPLARDERKYLALPLAAGAVALLIYAQVIPTLAETPGTVVYLLSFFVMAGCLGGLPAFYALRATRTSSDVSQRQFAILASAIALYTGFLATAVGTTRSTSILDPTYGGYMAAAGLPPILVAIVLWLRASARIEASRAARNTALLCAAMPLLGLLYVALELEWGSYGLARIAMVAVLAYGIARHQLLGLDLKVRWAVSKSTIAAVFIAVFFIASEAAQQFFGETLGSTYVGIAAAGTLVFAMAPLQRAAERLAERAVPVASPPASAPGAAAGAPLRREDVYREAVRYTLRDGVMTRDEELHLARLATELGLTPERAVELRHETAENGVRA